MTAGKWVFTPSALVDALLLHLKMDRRLAGGAIAWVSRQCRGRAILLLLPYSAKPRFGTSPLEVPALSK